MGRTRSELVTSCSPDELCFTNTSGPLHAIPAPSTRLGHMEKPAEATREEEKSQNKSDVNRNLISTKACEMENYQGESGFVDTLMTVPSAFKVKPSDHEQVWCLQPRVRSDVFDKTAPNTKRAMDIDEQAPAEKMMKLESSTNGKIVSNCHEEQKNVAIVPENKTVGEENNAVKSNGTTDDSKKVEDPVPYSAKYAWTWRDVEAHPLLVEKGITNIKNKCYAISIFQLLAHIPPVLKIVEDHHHEDNLYQQDCIACEWTRYVLHINVRPTHTSFYWFERCFEEVWPEVKNNEQEDATEALFHILLKLDIIAAMRHPPSTKFVASEDIFGFRITIGRKCLTCNSNVESTQVHKSLNLPFPQDPENTPKPLAKKNPKLVKNAQNKREYELEEMLDHYFKTNKINPVRCHKCEQDRTVSENQYIARLPNVLLVHILRFETNLGQIVKIDNPVVAPCDLKLAKYASEDCVETNYELTGMLIHSGSNCEKGHYHTLVQKYRQPNEWINLDDHTIGEVKHKYERQAYLLVYRRKSHTSVDKVYIRDYSRVFDYSASFLTADHGPPPKKDKRDRDHQTSPRRGSRQEH